MKRTMAKRIEAIESIHGTQKVISRIIRVIGQSACNFWDVESVTVRDLAVGDETTIKRTGNFKDYQSFIDLDRAADELIKTNQFGSHVLKRFNMVEGKHEQWLCEVPEDAINVHLSEPIMSFERLYPDNPYSDTLNVYIPHNGRDPIK